MLDSIGLPLLGAGVHKVGLGTKLGRELGEAVARIHLDAIICATTGVGWLESAMVGGAMEGDQLVETVTNPLEGAAGAIDDSVRPTDLAAVGLGFANDLLGNFNDAVENVCNRASKFAGRGVFRSWRGLNVCICRHSEAKCECDQKELFHYETEFDWTPCHLAMAK